ncbi:hypothetical protein TraAM80_00850 [Trypanosoma rangeli]|uniref:Uncharacterized protein n=1 Tax=Trypanosoma rangeli TaxID=5698 RepID=A0A3S5ISI8_TRYRA|nr:uncharacterized protein TraAM80_00850 [Trypanosoma rangeli]RNF11523.1 hypothetical protein TraAM80_00850 [Trypanosoma rangeli]|eukprot:RNF11523.1 hypothetical protein TraAM80_00850 [Trypanosoma rangeli]
MSSFRRRTTASKAVQTETSFPWDCADTDRHLEELASEQYQDLCRLRDMIRAAMKEVACSVYDVVAFKDIIFKIEDEMPSKLPVTDALLLSSKLFRRTSALGRLLGCLFAVVFAEEHADENFHFTEIRVLRRELMEVKTQFAEAEKERVRLQRMLDDVGKAAMSHSRAVNLLETQNAALQLQATGLEDQMGLLFAQVNKDLHRQCKDAYEKVTNEIDLQDRMTLTRATFRQTMDSLSDQLRHSRTLINDVRELVVSCAHTGAAAGAGGARGVDVQISKEPSIRFKLKQVENNFQQLVGRFSSVKGVVAEAAQELMNALHERKNILYLSLQHIRLYDIQNMKMRRSKAIIVAIKQSMEELLKRISVTFPAGAVTFVDRIGRISTQQFQVGQTLATLRQQRALDQVGEESVPNSAHSTAFASPTGFPVGMHAVSEDQTSVSTSPTAPYSYDTTDTSKLPFPTVYSVVDLIKQAERSMESLNRVLNFENEINAFLKTLTLSLSTTPRSVDETLRDLQTEDDMVDRALLPTGSLPPQREAAVDTTARGVEREPESGMSHPSLFSASAIGDMRTPADTKQQRAQKDEQAPQIKKLQEQLDSLQPEFAAKISFLRQVYEARICDLEVKEANYQRRINAVMTSKEGKEQKEIKNLNIRQDRTSPVQRAPETTIDSRHKKEDKEQLLQQRSEWQQTKPVLQANKKSRDATLNELTKMLKGGR